MGGGGGRGNGMWWRVGQHEVVEGGAVGSGWWDSMRRWWRVGQWEVEGGVVGGGGGWGSGRWWRVGQQGHKGEEFNTKLDN